jgi:hypothetical protein
MYLPSMVSGPGPKLVPPAPPTHPTTGGGADSKPRPERVGAHPLGVQLHHVAVGERVAAIHLLAVEAGMTSIAG